MKIHAERKREMDYIVKQNKYEWKVLITLECCMIEAIYQLFISSDECNECEP